MKPCLFTLVFISLLITSCRKHKPPVEQLPPATQEGRGTFGCLVDGKVFKPKGSPFGGPILICAYQFHKGGHYFHIAAKNQGDELRGMYINTDSLAIQEGKTYLLGDFSKKGGASGGYYVGKISSSIEYLTTASNNGELKILKLDTINRIVSGTFWFDAVNKEGQKVQVRDGRFDLKYSL
jgi:hypothetical protein